MQTKTAIRRAVGRGKFTNAEFAQAAEVSGAVARRRLASLVADGIVTELDETQPVTDAAGEPSRGRPRKLFRVA